MTKSLVALVGMKHRKTEALVASLPKGEPLVLIREPTNQYDPFAVQVWARDVHLGFVKGTQVKSIALAMDRAGITAQPGTLQTDGGRWPMVEYDDGPPDAAAPAGGSGGADLNDIPEAGEEFFQRAKLILPPRKPEDDIG
jgi:hypothetical protein